MHISRQKSITSRSIKTTGALIVIQANCQVTIQTRQQALPFSLTSLRPPQNHLPDPRSPPNQGHLPSHIQHPPDNQLQQHLPDLAMRNAEIQAIRRLSTRKIPQLEGSEPTPDISPETSFLPAPSKPKNRPLSHQDPWSPPPSPTILRIIHSSTFFMNSPSSPQTIFRGHQTL
jgi:hypothetical protein